jgi:hypothetical protein
MITTSETEDRTANGVLLMNIRRLLKKMLACSPVSQDRELVDEIGRAMETVDGYDEMAAETKAKALSQESHGPRVKTLVEELWRSHGPRSRSQENWLPQPPAADDDFAGSFSLTPPVAVGGDWENSSVTSPREYSPDESKRFANSLR